MLNVQLIPSMDRHLNVVEGFVMMIPGAMLLGPSTPGRVTQSKLVQSKNDPADPNETETTRSRCPLPGKGLLAPHPGARPGGGARKGAPVVRAFTHGARPGSAQMSYMGSHPRRESQKGRVHCV